MILTGRSELSWYGVTHKLVEMSLLKISYACGLGSCSKCLSQKQLWKLSSQVCLWVKFGHSIWC